MELDTSDLDAQIAALQAERAKKLRKADYARAVLKKEQEKVLIGSTPTKPALRGSASFHLPLDHVTY